ncbi:dephospho-CoA kinase [Oceanihabitans sediminis]|uniref:Dephospho-CoA kinase n=1 Tax=Oceanihabitans sediminis TaxID=1812012 RepID=A0A368P770_9FLAO|nr:dephospho-CoA kinase [Oceanihabitans sediminis]MDX1277738.1 dephospho-CoA kinase [Oceanihabitans sediminis]MDX1773283.1 dephospho-CoA kinase [Oceanihabitans sediminis]RBP32714.1 dephospho-CoA kinase [Oceanihabitans sediminis]RCU57745.1 dephospho-CoA kinase [Oceanihabitans sediminis]
MKIVGLTGGIGSGKTTVAKEFKKLGVPIYIADDEAKKLMNTSKVIKRKLVELFGEEAYINEELNRPYLAKIIFNDESYLQKMNAIVHPRVAKHFQKWVKKQDSPYIIKEVAILFENGSYKHCDFIITVTAKIQTRIERLLKRDNTTVSKIEAIMKNQWQDDKKIALSDFVIKNNVLEDTVKQVQETHNQLLNSIYKR